jgi:hypothetical protein
MCQLTDCLFGCLFKRIDENETRSTHFFINSLLEEKHEKISITGPEKHFNILTMAMMMGTMMITKTTLSTAQAARTKITAM